MTVRVMDVTPSILTLPLPDIAADVVDVVGRYQPRLLTPQQAASALPSIKHLVLACGPLSGTDAEAMLATASRFLADAATTGPLDVDALVNEFQVSRWLYDKVRKGMPPQTVANHRQRLARFLRVRRGLPARMSVRSSVKQPGAPLGDDVRLELVASLAVTDAHVAAAYVAAVGAGAIASEAVGAAVRVVDDGYWLVLGDRRWAVVSELWPLASAVVGVTVESDSWATLRSHAADLDIKFDRTIARATFSVLAISEDGSPAALIPRFSLTRRAVDDAVAFLPSVDAAVVAVLLRG